MSDSYCGVPIVEVSYIPSVEQMESDNALTLARIVEVRAEWIAETDEVMGALGIMASTASDHDADIISRAMALIEMGSYD